MHVENNRSHIFDWYEYVSPFYRYELSCISRSHIFDWMSMFTLLFKDTHACRKTLCSSFLFKDTHVERIDMSSKKPHTWLVRACYLSNIFICMLFIFSFQRCACTEEAHICDWHDHIQRYACRKEWTLVYLEATYLIGTSMLLYLLKHIHSHVHLFKDTHRGIHICDWHDQPATGNSEFPFDFALPHSARWRKMRVPLLYNAVKNLSDVSRHLWVRQGDIWRGKRTFLIFSKLW